MTAFMSTLQAVHGTADPDPPCGDARQGSGYHGQSSDRVDASGVRVRPGRSGLRRRPRRSARRSSRRLGPLLGLTVAKLRDVRHTGVEVLLRAAATADVELEVVVQTIEPRTPAMQDA